MDFWQKVKRDVQKGLKDGVEVMKEGVAVAKEKAGEMSDEGKRRYQIFLLKTKVQKEISELGGKVYGLSAKVKNPMLDSTVKAAITRIKKIELQIVKLEKNTQNTVKKSVKKVVARTTKKIKKIK
ncbi:MAG: hypothetical protein IT392_10780 [Nitrospirae bacterium]|nr:hypothetical protein [Nitrospirota bacterium]